MIYSLRVRKTVGSAEEEYGTYNNKEEAYEALHKNVERWAKTNTWPFDAHVAEFWDSL